MPTVGALAKTNDTSGEPRRNETVNDQEPVRAGRKGSGLLLSILRPDVAGLLDQSAPRFGVPIFKELLFGFLHWREL